MPGCTWSRTHFCISVTMGRPCLTACCSASESCLRGLTLGPGRCQCRTGLIFAKRGRCPPVFQPPRGKLARGAACLAEPPELLTLVSKKSIWVRESPCTKCVRRAPMPRVQDSKVVGTHEVGEFCFIRPSLLRSQCAGANEARGGRD